MDRLDSACEHARENGAACRHLAAGGQQLLLFLPAEFDRQRKACFQRNQFDGSLQSMSGRQESRTLHTQESCPFGQQVGKEDPLDLPHVRRR